MARKSAGAELSEFAMALYTLVEAVRREHEEAAARVGLTAAQATILSLLSEPVSMRHLAERMGCDASNITGLIDRLETKGLVRRTADPDDRRIKRIVQTAKGEAAMERFMKQLLQASPLADLSPANRRLMLKMLAEMGAGRGIAPQRSDD